MLVKRAHFEGQRIPIHRGLQDSEAGRRHTGRGVTPLHLYPLVFGLSLKKKKMASALTAVSHHTEKFSLPGDGGDT